MKKLILLTVLFSSMLIAKDARSQAFYRQTAYTGNLSDGRQAAEASRLFPNPAINEATVVLGFIPRERLTIEIFDFNGTRQNMMSFLPGNRQLSFDVTNLERGYYVVRIYEGQRFIQTMRLVKD